MVNVYLFKSSLAVPEAALKDFVKSSEISELFYFFQLRSELTMRFFFSVIFKGFGNFFNI